MGRLLLDMGHLPLEMGHLLLDMGHLSLEMGHLLLEPCKILGGLAEAPEKRGGQAVPIASE